MSVKLYQGCWGVQVDKKVVGPLKPSPSSYSDFLIEGPPYQSWMRDGLDTPFGDLAKSKRNIIAVFPTEADAHAYLTRKPWWNSY